MRRGCVSGRNGARPSTQVTLPMLDTRRAYAPAFALAALSACQVADPPSDHEGAELRDIGDVATTTAEVPDGDTFAYLLSRYDANGDETITTDEYTRHEVQLSRWDSNGDGVLTGVDFDVPEPSYAEIGELRKARVAGRYFQVTMRTRSCASRSWRRPSPPTKGPAATGS